MPYTQTDRLIAIDTPLGDDVLLLQSLAGQEGVSRLFSFNLDLLSEHASISFEDIVGQQITASVTLGDGSQRCFNGYVSQFLQGGSATLFTHYQMEVVPWLWFLTRNANCRIFQNLSVPDIIQSVFSNYSFSSFKNSLTASYEPRDYCVQYRETDFNFVSRLMEQYGIFYFFEHENGKHTLVLGDSPAVYQVCPGQDVAHYNQTIGDLDSEDVITGWDVKQELHTGKYSLTDYNFETPSTSLMSSDPTVVEIGGNSAYEIYDYPGDYLNRSQGSSLTRIRMQEMEAAHKLIRGSSVCRAFTAGYKFDLEAHYLDDMNDSYVLTEVQHSASVGASYGSKDASSREIYSNHFTCALASEQLRPARITRRPFVQGPQTAVVVGKSGEEVWVDAYGRVKVQFHWDRLGKKDENSSCWIRVSQPWAGQNWGAMWIPRIGQEVIVSFLEGDPDRPLITGRVYNAEQMPPYPLPDSGNISGFKSNSTKGGGGYNEMSFDDTKGKEKMTVHAQKDMGTTVEHNDTQTVHNNRAIKVDGTHNETITKDTNITIEKGPYKLDVQNNTHIHHVKKDVNEWYDANQQTVVANNILIQSKTAKITVDAAEEIFLHCGQSMMSMKKDGSIVISGQNIQILGGQTVKTGVGNQNVVCDVQKVATSGAAINSNAVGMHTITGAVVKIN
jgi:type VI secretion system secreted protein VgrG